MNDTEAAELRKWALERIARSHNPDDVLASLPDADKLARWLMTGELPSSDAVEQHR